MKKLIKSVFIVALSLSTAGAVGTNDTLYKSNGKELQFENLKPGHTLYIKNEDGKVLYQKEIDQKGTYTNDFDLASLPKGDYRIEIDKDFEIQMIPFTVSEQVEVMQEKSSVFFKPVVRKKGAYVYISKLALDNESMKVNVFYNGDTANKGFDKIYSETLSQDKNLGRVYKLDTDAKGEYKIVVTTKDRTFSKVVKI